ncbi:hypothetical protein KR222_005903 [Zaprionus bogoriensis]|nr:hypothetical protein KR222_005903 [Zaprionus bogoriensis]
MASLCFWNDFELKKPPLITIQVGETGFAKNVFVLINRYLQQLSAPDAKDFNETAALLGRLMARRKNSFRGMPGFRAVCKLNAALCRLLRLDLPRELEHFRSALPDVCDDELSGEMPTRSSFEYILVRMLSFHRLQQRIRECCLAAAKYFAQMLRMNYFLDSLTLLIAAIAKINRLSTLQANNCASLYNKLLPQRPKFPQVEKHQFLSEQCELPKQLQQIKLPQLPVEEKDPAAVTLNVQAPTVVTKLDKAKKKAKADVGQKIERQQEAAPVETDFHPSALFSVEDVKQFIVRETKARKQSPDDCLTKAIKNHEWQAAKALFERKVQAKEQTKAVNIFRKFIGNKI